MHERLGSRRDERTLTVPIATDAAELESLAAALEQLVSIETRRNGQHRGVVAPLYEAAREASGGSPTLAAARALHAAATQGGTVVITLGAHDPDHMPFGETDGPPGVAALGQALISVGGQAVVACESFQVPAVRLALAALGTELGAAPGERGTVSLLEIPAVITGETRWAPTVLDDLAASAVVAVERMGPNANGVIHTSTGKESRGVYGPVHLLFEEAARRGLSSVGIGDNGNEIGMGTIAAAVAEHKPNGGLIGSAHAVDHLIVANVSNWGAYALAALLRKLGGIEPVIHSPSEERAMVEACLAAGAVDGATGVSELGVDGTSLVTQEAIVTLIAEITTNHYRTRERAY